MAGHVMYFNYAYLEDLKATNFIIYNNITKSPITQTVSRNFNNLILHSIINS